MSTSPTSSSSASKSKHKSSHIGAIIGAVVAFVAFMLMIGAWLAFRRYRSRKTERPEVDLIEAEEDTTPHPFHPPPPTGSSSSSSVSMSQKQLAFSPLSHSQGSFAPAEGVPYNRTSHPSVAPVTIPRPVSPSPNIPSSMFPPPPQISDSPTLLTPIATSPTTSRLTMASAMERAIQKSTYAGGNGRGEGQAILHHSHQETAPVTSNEENTELLESETRSEQFSPAPPSYTTHYDHHGQGHTDVEANVDE